VIAATLMHWGLEIAGSASWACLRGRCQHRRHRIALDLLATLVASVITVKLLG